MKRSLNWVVPLSIVWLFWSQSVHSRIVPAWGDLQLGPTPSWSTQQGPPTNFVIPPRKPKTETLDEQLFNERLVKNFKERYEERFGPIELAYLSPELPEIKVIKIKDFTLTERETVIKENEELQEFGEYVAKKLAEHQVDVLLRSNPRTIKAYEAKEAITNARWTIGSKKKYRVRARYSVSGNFIDVRLENPFVNSRITFQVGGETIYHLGRTITRTIYMDTLYREKEGRFTVLAKHYITPSVTGSFEGSTYFHKRAVVANEHEKIALLGLSFAY